MHELSLAESICRSVVEHVPEGQRVLRVIVVWGPLSGVVPEALEFCFGVAAAAHGLEGAQLDLQRQPAGARCSKCEAEFTVEQMWASCPHCGHAPVTVLGGDEFRLSGIEVDDV